MNDSPPRSGAAGRLVGGLLVIALGMILLAGNLGWIDGWRVIRTLWPLVFVAAGVAMLRDTEKPQSRAGGWVFIVAGVWIFLDKLGWIGINIWQLLVPGLLLFAGGTLVWRALKEPSALDEAPRRPSLINGEPQVPRRRDFIHSACMSYSELHPVSRPFVHAELNAVMGGIKIDLRDVSMEGDSATLDVFTFWGSIELLVPPDWSVSGKVVTIIGGFMDNRRPTSVVPMKTLIIRGYNIMSGIEVKN